ncbi:MAG: MFS transporter [Lactobacillus sp.]|jgi:MFS family permease|nr:MFS transporter [Lactobacillus sp.]
MIKNKLRQNVHVYYVATLLLIISGALPHAVLTIILLNKGLTLSQIMLVQAGFSLAIMLSEYPSGLLADTFSRKKIFLISKLFMIAMFLMVIYGNSFSGMVLAWFLYGIANALDSGTIDADLINHLKEGHAELGLSKFIKNNNRLSFLALLIGSTIGSLLYYQVGIKFYFLSILLTLTAIGLVAILYDEKNMNKAEKHMPAKPILAQGKAGILELRHSKALKMMMGLSFVGQFFFQTHYQLWQALYLYHGINQRNFYLFYLTFQIISILAYSMPTPKSGVVHYQRVLCLLLFVFAGLIFGLYSKMNVLFIASYILLVFLFTIFDYISSYIFAKNVSAAHISALTSLKSTCGRIAALISLGLSSFLLNFFSVQTVATLNFVFATIFSIAVVLNFYTIFKNRKLVFKIKA